MREGAVGVGMVPYGMIKCGWVVKVCWGPGGSLRAGRAQLGAVLWWEVYLGTGRMLDVLPGERKVLEGCKNIIEGAVGQKVLEDVGYGGDEDQHPQQLGKSRKRWHGGGPLPWNLPGHSVSSVYATGVSGGSLGPGVSTNSPPLTVIGAFNITAIVDWLTRRAPTWNSSDSNLLVELKRKLSPTVAVECCHTACSYIDARHSSANELPGVMFIQLNINALKMTCRAVVFSRVLHVSYCDAYCCRVTLPKARGFGSCC
ncbi:hypothetical protein DFJ58DRAFT_917160 [Suillus subalutaceus]|uniref:uncharacterized protein n=1 Tax=Suillus subalutaceus TaxID=48586 RepID=UPI001B880199|nr:uncharacterized protein DFJ58DRAFT_917160 [Suillus subalutaceus]KAG1838523.1 hypothetical protein DFJ58DRAFT_917160 [Suillus subalutaceus]